MHYFSYKSVILSHVIHTLLERRYIYTCMRPLLPQYKPRTTWFIAFFFGHAGTGSHSRTFFLLIGLREVLSGTDSNAALSLHSCGVPLRSYESYHQKLKNNETLQIFHLCWHTSFIIFFQGTPTFSSHHLLFLGTATFRF